MLLDESRRLTQEAPKIVMEEVPPSHGLERSGWKNWFLLTAILFATTTGLGATVVALLHGRGYSPWPWGGSDLLLLVSLAVAQGLFIGYLTWQQKRVTDVRQNLIRIQRQTIEQVEHHYRRLDDILEVTRTTGSLTDPQAVFDVITNTCANTFRCDQVSLMLYDPREKTLSVRSAVGHRDLTRVIGARQRVGHGVAGWVAENREPLILGTHVDPARFRELQEQLVTLSAAMIVPIILREELLGVLSASSRAEGMRYDATDLRALEVFAGNVGVTIRHAQQSEWMRETIRRLDAALQEQEIQLGLTNRSTKRTAVAA